MCKLRKRTFSLLPHGLLPFRFLWTETLLKQLHGMVVEGIPTNTCAKRWGVARSTLRRLKEAFLRTVPKLRLPGTEGALGPDEFLGSLADLRASGIASLFQAWKEKEPKRSVVGIYSRSRGRIRA